MSVAAMDSVYRCAQCVIVALLDIEVPLAHQAFLRDFIKDYESSNEPSKTPHLSEKPPFLGKHPVLKRFIYVILDSRWFTQAWCSHEMELGEYFVFYVPCQPARANGNIEEMLAFSSTFLWDLLCLSSEVPGGVKRINDLRDKLMKVFDFRRRVLRVRQSLANDNSRQGHRVVEDAKFAKEYGLKRPYTTVIRDVFELGAGGDPDLPSHLRKSSANVDKMSIVLNTLGNGLAVCEGHKMVIDERECMRHLLMLGLAARDSSVLCTVGQHFSFGAETDRLSWLCQPTFTDLGSGGRRHDYLPSMSEPISDRIQFDQSPAMAWIELDVFALGTPRPPDEKYRSLASQLTQKGIELGMGRKPAGPLGDAGAEYAGKTDLVSRVMLMTIDAQNQWGPGPLYQYWQNQTFIADDRERFNWTIACILECGMKWMLGTAEKCGFPNPPWLETSLRAAFDKDDFAGIDDMSWARSESGRQAVDAIFSMAMWAVCWGVVMLRDGRGQNMPMLFDHGQNGMATIYLVGDALMQTVIPCPLIPDEYGRLYRIWLLQAKDDPFYEKLSRGETAEWFLRRKAILFTDVDGKSRVFSTDSAGDGNPGWRLRERARIYGPPREF